MTGFKLVFDFEDKLRDAVPFRKLESLLEVELNSLILYKKDQDGTTTAYNNVSIKEVYSYHSATGLRTIFKFWSKGKEYSIIGGEESEYGFTWFLIMDSIEQVKETNRALKRIVQEQEREAKISSDLDLLEQMQKKFRESNPEYAEIMDQMDKLPKLPQPNYPPANPQPGWPYPQGPGYPGPFPGSPWDTSESIKKYTVTTTTGTSYCPELSTTAGDTARFNYRANINYGSIMSYSGVPILIKD